MKTMEIYEPSMCCSTGVCGVNVDTELLRVAAVLDNLKKHGIVVNRYNLSSAPQAFVANAAVSKELQEKGANTLPVILVDGEIIIRKRYPTNEEFCSILGVPCDYVSSTSDCCGNDSKQNSGCCGGSTKKGGGCCC